MKPVPNLILSALLIALCGLCFWQWHREARLRALVSSQGDQLVALTGMRDDLEARVKAADAEVLRITASMAELRANSVSKEVHDEVLKANATLRESAIKQIAAITQQNAAITQQNELITKQNASIQRANDNLKKLITERDDLAKRLNELTALYNKLAKPGSPSS